MRGIVLHCSNPQCRKLLIKDANLPLGTNFTVKCFHCGRFIRIVVDPKTGLNIIVDNFNYNKKDDGDIIII